MLLDRLGLLATLLASLLIAPSLRGAPPDTRPSVCRGPYKWYQITRGARVFTQQCGHLLWCSLRSKHNIASLNGPRVMAQGQFDALEGDR